MNLFIFSEVFRNQGNTIFNTVYKTYLSNEINENKHRENYIIGEVITEHKGFNLGFYFIKSDFKSYNIEYYDKIKLNKLREENIVVGYYVNNKNSLKTYNNMFDSLIIDNYIGITSR